MDTPDHTAARVMPLTMPQPVTTPHRALPTLCLPRLSQVAAGAATPREGKRRAARRPKAKAVLSIGRLAASATSAHRANRAVDQNADQGVEEAACADSATSQRGGGSQSRPSPSPPPPPSPSISPSPCRHPAERSRYLDYASAAGPILSAYPPTIDPSKEEAARRLAKMVALALGPRPGPMVSSAPESPYLWPSPRPQPRRAREMGRELHLRRGGDSCR